MQDKKPKSLKEALISKLPKDIFEKVNRSFEVIGNIAICEIPDKIIEYEEIIAQTLLELNTNITTVLKKISIHNGEFRTQEMKVIGGINTKTTTYKENGINLEIDVEQIYFSAKLSTEREVLAKEVKDYSNQLVLFSGAGPYTFVVTKHNPNINQITSVELNPIGHKFAQKNLKHNKNNLKHNTAFKEIFNEIKKNNIPLYDKHVIANFNSLMYQFYNISAKDFKPKIRGNKEKFNEDDTNIFQKEPLEVFNFLKDSNERTTFYLKDFSKEHILKNIKLSLICFPNKFKYVLSVEDYTLFIETLHEKNYLFNYCNNPQLTCEDLIKYDEIYMPLPKTAHQYLDVAFKCAKKGCIIHLYNFLPGNEFPKGIEELVNEYAKKHNYQIKILQTRKVGQYSPGKYRVCCDFKIL